MKICWDMLEGVHLSRRGTFRKSETTYIYKEACERCGESYLTVRCNQSVFCSFSCAQSGENNHRYGKVYTTEERKRISIATKGKNNGMYGKTHTIDLRRQMSEKKSTTSIPNWRGGIQYPGLTSYEVNKDILCVYEDIRKQKSTDVLEVKCAYCGKWFAPMYKTVKYRLDAVNNMGRGEGRLYCSDNCKRSCPTYNQKNYPKDFKKGTSREVSTYLRKMVFERDNWECQKCGKTEKEAPLHCHHIKGYTQNKMLANDVDNCITFCKECHEEVHKRYGCRYVDLRCKEEN